MKVLLASPRGFCAGVKRAIEIVDLALQANQPPVYVRKEIVHNRFVVEDLRQRGAVFVEEIDCVPEGATVIFSAHGVAPTVRDQANGRKLRTIDATCPLVTKVHREVGRFLDEGYELALIGHVGHDEVVGTMGQAPGKIALITCADDARRAKFTRPDRLMVLTQTTLSTDDAGAIMKALRERVPKLSLPPSEDICYATRNRQKAVKEIAGRAPVIIVIGSQNSSNSIRLREVAAGQGSEAFLINHVAEMDWPVIAGAHTVGVTAGASAPEGLVQELVNTLVQRYGASVEEVGTVRETVRFSLPEGLSGPSSAAASSSHG